MPGADRGADGRRRAPDDAPRGGPEPGWVAAHRGHAPRGDGRAAQRRGGAGRPIAIGRGARATRCERVTGAGTQTVAGDSVVRPTVGGIWGIAAAYTRGRVAKLSLSIAIRHAARDPRTGHRRPDRRRE